MPNPTNALIEQAGHEIIKTGKYYRCLTCSQTWTHSKRANLLMNGTCPGPGIWGCDEGKLCRPRQIPRGSSLIWAGNKIHDTHRLGYTQGLLFCRGCGAYTASTRVEGLTQACRMKPKNASAKFVLNRMLSGKHPDSRHALCPKGAFPPAPKWLG